MSETIINCTLNDLFNLSKGLGSCQVETNSGAFISIYNKKIKGFNTKFKSLIACFARNKKVIPEDLTLDNTHWIETLKNGSIRGMGKKFLDIFKQKALENNYKYVFLYPSSNFGGANSNQDELIEYYIKVGFEKLADCDFYSYNDKMEEVIVGTTNPYDNNVPYHFMFAEIKNLITDSPLFKSNVINYNNKYLKYKAKYLKLKAIK